MLLLTIEFDGVAPPVPAAQWVVDDSSRLWVDYDDVVQFSDLVVASITSKLVFQQISTRIYSATG